MSQRQAKFAFEKTPRIPIEHVIEKPVEVGPPRDWNPFTPTKHLKAPIVNPFSELMVD